MANVSAILALVGAILAALSALLGSGLNILLLVPAGFAVVAGIYIALQQKQNTLVLISGALAAIVGLVAILGLTMGWLESHYVLALTILANLEIAATALKTAWGDIPKAGAIGVSVALLAAAVLGFVFADELGFANIVATAAAGVLSLVGIYPAAIAMRE